MTISGKVKQALKGANKFGIAAILVAGVMAFSFKPDVKRLGAYRYTQPAQQWNNSTLDQDASHYTMVSSPESVSCNQSDKICTYDLIGGEFVQSTQGDFNQ